MQVIRVLIDLEFLNTLGAFVKFQLIKAFNIFSNCIPNSDKDLRECLDYYRVVI